MLILRVGQEKKGPPKDDNSSKAFINEDIDAIKTEIQNVKAVTAENSTTVNIVYGNKSYSSSVIGTTNDYFIIKDWNLSEGRVFDDIELNSGKTSCIIGTTIVKQLYAENETVVGTNIRLKNFSCNVIGVLESKGASAFVS